MQRYMNNACHTVLAFMMRREPLGFCACDGKEGMLKAAIEAFFEKEGMTVTFSDHCEIISPGCRTVSVAACQ